MNQVKILRIIEAHIKENKKQSKALFAEREKLLEMYCLCGHQLNIHDIKGDESCRVDVAEDPEITCDCKKFQKKGDSNDSKI